MRNRSKRSKRKKSRMAEVTNRGDIKRVNKLAPYLKNWTLAKMKTWARDAS
jgi:hypothetical protein